MEETKKKAGDLRKVGKMRKRRRKRRKKDEIKAKRKCDGEVQ